MFVWRLCSNTFIDSALSGEGARKKGNRWNHPGTPIVYSADSLSLAMLESLVHFDVEDIPDNYMQVKIFIPDNASVSRITSTELGLDWNKGNNRQQLKNIGTQWAKNKESLILIVPSVIVPDENNYIINPLHQEITSVTIQEIKEFTFDSRLLN